MTDQDKIEPFIQNPSENPATESSALESMDKDKTQSEETTSEVLGASELASPTTKTPTQERLEDSTLPNEDIIPTMQVNPTNESSVELIDNHKTQSEAELTSQLLEASEPSSSKTPLLQEKLEESPQPIEDIAPTMRIIKQKEEELRQLKLLKSYQEKHSLEELEDVIERWKSVARSAIQDLFERKKPASENLTMESLLTHLDVDASLIDLELESESD